MRIIMKDLCDEYNPEKYHSRAVLFGHNCDNDKSEKPFPPARFVETSQRRLIISEIFR